VGPDLPDGAPLLWRGRVERRPGGESWGNLYARP